MVLELKKLSGTITSIVVAVVVLLFVCLLKTMTCFYRMDGSTVPMYP